MQAQQPSTAWPIHSTDRPAPPVVAPGAYLGPVPPPADAIVLFDGRDLSAWQSEKGGPAGWNVKDGVMEVAGGSGSIQTRRGFGDVQLHVEWMAPLRGHEEGQGWGNSGVYLMGLYEVQVLNSWQNPTYPDGQAAAVYGQYPPLVNASRPPGEWQTYDIIFHRPRFDSQGDFLAPARLTVFHNGVLVQDNVSLSGPTAHHARPPYQAHPDRLPLLLQNHGDPVRYRDIWVRELE
ncbi:MAG: DUF1080 domain-containing protein [Gemmatimonadales bacterium]